MKRERKDKHFIKAPEYPGGNKEMGLFVGKNIIYPKDALENKTEGIVRIRIIIDYKGNVIQTNVIDHLGFGCDEEADRVVRLLQFNVPNNRGGKANFNRTLNIRFQLPKAKKSEVNVQYSYSVPTEKEAVKKSKPASIGYTITINKKQ